MSGPASDNILLGAVCQEIVTLIAEAVSAETKGVRVLKLPGGPEVGKQLTIDAPGEDKLMNQCRLSILNPDLAPAGEAARIEFEHDKPSPSGVHRVYAVQSVRRGVQGGLVLMEDFLAETPQMVREEDFRPITSETYARGTVLKSVQDWTSYRAWQRQQPQK
ncbi:MAG TPA: hypothetical protein VHQ86_02430 [Candidatus Saccharimonadia bacterium]|jgi:hypothetical protein|nr:hypothetical protein [Candidatus Saccharimonadia bacterium]